MQLQRLVQVLVPVLVQLQRLVPPQPRGLLPLPQAQTYQLPLRAQRQPQQQPQERLAGPLRPWEREPVRPRALVQQQAQVRAQEREQQGPQEQQPQALQQSPHRIQVPQWLASSCRHASIAPMRLSKPNQSRCCASCESLGPRPKTQWPSAQTMQQRGSISYILLSFLGDRRRKRLLKHGCKPSMKTRLPRRSFCHSGVSTEGPLRA